MPSGTGDMTLAELQEMATRQQQQMDSQQQVLVAKEQRLKYLRQQEARHTQLASEGERIRKMRERVESQELKLKKLRALRGQVEMYKSNNGNINGELDAVKAVFNEKEKELATAVARVDRLNRQLQELRNNNSAGQQLDNKQATVAEELKKLRNELLVRNKLNEQQSTTISAKEKMLAQRREEVARMDLRIQELQLRLKKRQAQELQMRQQRALQEQQMKGFETNRRYYVSGDKDNRSNLNGGRSVATVEPYIQYAPHNVAKDDLYSKTKSTGSVDNESEDRIGNFHKQDPKYQTLPARVKSMPSASDKDGGIDTAGRAHPRPFELNNNKEMGELIEEYQLPTVIPGNMEDKNNEAMNRKIKSHQHFFSQDGYLNRQGSNHPSAELNQNFVNHHQRHHEYPQPHSAGLGAGDGLSGLSNRQMHQHQVPTCPPNPVINIQEEERQAGSGQSSPASSEASSGGIQVKTEGEINTSSIGSVSAVIEKLNKSGLTTFTPNPTSTSHGLDRSVFTKRNQQQNLDHKASGKVTDDPYLYKHPPPNTFSSSGERNKSNPENQQPVNNENKFQPHPSEMSRNVDGDIDQISKSGAIFNQPNANKNNQHFPSNQNPPTSQSSSNHGPPHLNQKPAPTYRYASKNQIANTYMGRLGSGAMDKYQKNINQLYKNLDVSDATAHQGKEVKGQEFYSTGEVTTSFSQSSGTRGAKDVTDGIQQVAQSDPPHAQFGAVSSPGYPDIASDKGSFKLNTPKQVRRRHSDSENEDLNKALQQRQDTKQQNENEVSTNTSTAIQSKSDIASSKLESKPKVSDKSQENTPVADMSTSNSSLIKHSSTSDAMKVNPSQSASSSSSDSKLDLSNVKTDSSIAAPKNNEDESKVVRRGKSNLKKQGSGQRSSNRVSFDPLALLLDASLEGELDLVKKVAVQVDDVSTPNDEGITALHNAICAGHYDIVKVLVEFGCDVNSPDSDGWTPLHCAASCNNLPMVQFLVEHGACVFATTISDQETAADKCEEEEDGYDGCSDYLYSVQEKLGITNGGEVYGVFDYQAKNTDELSFRIGDKLTVLRKGDDTEKEWWWARLTGHDGYIPRNLLGLHPRVLPVPREVSDC